MQQSAYVKVEYKTGDGWHVFSSRDLPGLYVASPDAERAYDDVPSAIEKLLKLNAGIECEVIPQLPFSEFMKLAKGEKQEPARTYSNRTFSIAACEPALACG